MLKRTTIGVVLKPGVPEAWEALAQCQRRLTDVRWIGEASGHHKIPQGLSGVECVEAQQFEAESDLLLVLGGDGTLLHAVSLLQTRRVPVLGVNLGHIGFLTEVAREELVELLPQAIDGALPMSERMRLDVQVKRGDEVLLARRVLNDAVFAMRSLARVATYQVFKDNDIMTTIRGDGVIVSSPTGSTAYALASGGPVVSPEVEALVLTPIAPHMLTQRPLVMPARGILEIQLVSPSDAFASLDGHFGHQIGEGDRMTVCKAEVGALLIGVPWRNYYQMLRTKLRWGGG